MLSAIVIISFIFGLPALFGSILSQAEFWQRKEYRVDRALVALASFELLLAARVYAAALALVIISWVLLSLSYLHLANTTSLASLAVILLFHIQRTFSKGLFRPQLTPKAIAILLTALLLTTTYIWYSAFLLLAPTLHLATAVLLIPFITTIAVNLINLLTDWRKHKTVTRATKLRASLSQLKVIGITGSYGKTSTKHFLLQLLPHAQVSQQHRNSEFPIALDVLEQLTPNSQTYIVEMGAYRRGEIKTLAKITQPNIGLITAIGSQHLATFGSPANILKGKWELIEALPKDGIAVLSADQSTVEGAEVVNFCRVGVGGKPRRQAGRGISEAKIRPPRCRIICYSTKNPTDVYVDNIDIKDRSISCRLHIKDFVSDVTVPLAGEAALASITAAVAAAHALGTDNEQIIQRLKQLKPYPQTMELITAKQGSTVIDDSYSANEQGVLSAIKHLGHFPQPDKRIVLVPLIELGRKDKVVHQRIGQALVKSGATVYVYGHAFQKQLNARQSDKVHFITQPKELVRQVTNNLTPQTVILLEGRLPNVLKEALL